MLVYVAFLDSEELVPVARDAMISMSGTIATATVAHQAVVWKRSAHVHKSATFEICHTQFCYYYDHQRAEQVSEERQKSQYENFIKLLRRPLSHCKNYVMFIHSESPIRQVLPVNKRIYS